MEFKTTRASAIENLDNFIKNNLGEYSKLRNFDFGPDKRSNTSCLSPYITHGVINEKEVIDKSLERFSFSKNEKFIQEVLWRTYWKGWLELRPKVWMDFLKDLKEKHRKLSEQVIPERMAELGMTSTTMADGSRVDIVENIYVSIPKDAEKSKACYDWLEDNGLGDIIKNQVGISFGKGEGNMAKHLEETIKEMGLIPEVKVSVHPSTLKATIKKWHEEGRSVPDNTFSLFIGQKTKVTKKK